MRVVIVASGPSAKNFVPPVGAVVIAVNGAIDWLARADYFFTLDDSPVNCKRLENQRDGVRYCVALPGDSPRMFNNVSRFTRISHRGIEPAQRHSSEWHFWRWGCVAGLNTTYGKINTGNSAWGALGLALHLNATRVALVGVDASGDERIEGGFTNSLKHLPLLFESAIGQIDFINCGAMKSRVKQLGIEEGMQWLMQ